MPPTPLSRDEVRRAVADAVGQPADAIGDDVDLVTVGLDSLQVMKLATVWYSRGAQIGFGELLERRTLAQWWDLLSSRQGPSQSPPAAPAVDADAEFELAPMQHAYWFGRTHSGSAATPAHFYFEFDGRHVEPRRLDEAMRRLPDRHPMLRARVTAEGRQQVQPKSPWPGLTVHTTSVIWMPMSERPVAARARGGIVSRARH